MHTTHRAVLARLCERWETDKHPEVKEAFDGIAVALLAELPAPEAAKTAGCEPNRCAISR